MKNFLIKYILVLPVLIASVVLTSCNQDEPNDSPYVGGDESTILLYAVSTNSLAGNLVQDKREIIEGAKEINLNRNNILLFQTAYTIDTENNRFDPSQCEITLQKLVKYGSQYEWEVIKEYSEDISPLNPSRVNEVITYVTNTFPADNYGLIFWSHSSASDPYLEGREFTASNGNSGMLYSFGQDKLAVETKYTEVNIDELASAIPDDLFDFIWFDSCYMSNIESIYQMRNKCNTYVGYPTEVLEYGMQYNLVLPHIVGSKPDLVKAADAFFQFYANSTATVAVVDTKKLELLADYCSKIYDPSVLVSASSLKRYSRGSIGPYYDFGDYTKAMAANVGTAIADEEWNRLLDEVVLYKNATKSDFVSYVDPDRYSGISTHIYNENANTQTEKYYRSLDWYNRVFVHDTAEDDSEVESD